MSFGSRHTASNYKAKAAWLSELEQMDKLQLTFSNTSQEDQLAQLWGANRGIELSSTEQSFSTDTYPQVIAQNPFNSYWYVVNQLAGSIEIFEASGELIKAIQVEQQYIGFASLVDLVFDSLTGTAYIIGAISNLLYIVDENLELIKTIEVANRPISIDFNSTTKQLVIAHLTEKTVSVVDPITENIELITLDNEPLDVVVNQDNGFWLTVESTSGGLGYYDASNQKLGTIEAIDSELKKAIVLQSGKALLIAKDQKELVLADLESLSIEARIQLDGTPFDIAQLPSGEVVAITGEPNEMILFDSELNQLSKRETTFGNAGIAIDFANDSLLIPNPLSNSIGVVAIRGNSSPIQASENYLEVLRDFQHKPVLMKHLKVHYSGQPTAPFIRICTKSSSGKTVSRLVSMEKYRSPQHFAPIFDLMEFENEIIDGRTFWEVLIPPEQSITLVLYYRQ